MEQLRVGAIGCGYWGPNLIRNFIEIAESELVAIADLQESQLAYIQNRFPKIQHATTDYHDFFGMNLDAVVIATPPHTHYAIAKECLMNGLSVLVEKPITLESEHARELSELAAAKGLVLMVGHTFEYNSAVHALKGMIDSGELGDIYYIDAVRASLGLFQTKANVIWDLAPHDISIMRYLLGEDPESVRAHGVACVQEGTVDVAYMTMMFPKNVMAHIRTSWLDPSKTRKITVVGSKKMVIYDDVESLGKIKVFDKGVKAIRRTDTFGDWHFAYHYGDQVIPYIRFEEPLRQQCLHFIECVQEGKTPRSDGYSGMNVVKVIEAAQYSLENGGGTVELAAYQPVRLNGQGSH